MSPWVLLLALPLALPWLPAPSLGVGVLLALLLGVAGAAYAYATRHFGYWRRRGVPFLRPLPVAGNLKDVLLFRRHIGEVLHEVYTQMKGQRYLGMYFLDQPVLFVKDLSILKDIFHKDFEYFSDRSFDASHADVFNKESLFGRRGKNWKDLRVKLSPAFTSGKLKKFFVLLNKKAEGLVTFLDDAARKGRPLDVKEASARFTMDAVSTVGFGLEGRALVDDSDPLHTLLRSVFAFGRLYNILAIGMFVRMPLVKMLNVSLVPSPLMAFLRRTIWGVVEERQRAGVRGARGDFLDLLMELREKGHIADDDEASETPAAAHNSLPAANDTLSMDGDTLVAQSFTFLSAGFDTTATTMSFALYHIAKDEVIQEKLRIELKNALEEHNGKLTYEALQSVTYLDMIISETLRLYPILPFLDRACTKDYRIEGTNLVVEKGTIVFTSLLGIQHDPELYPDPERFDPERFSKANKNSLPSGAYMPFGEGPRMCIGMRLGFLQTKIGLAHIILNYKICACASTPSEMEYDLRSVLVFPRHGIPLNFSHVEEQVPGK